MANILYLVHRLPYPPNKGDKVRSYHLLKYLCERHRVFLGTFIDDPEDEKYIERVRKICPDLYIVHLSPFFAKIKSLSGLVTHDALGVHYYFNRSLQVWVNTVLTTIEIDATVIFSAVMAQYISTTSRKPVPPMLVDFVDVDSEKWAQYAEKHSWPLSWVYRREALRLLSFERSVALRSHRSFFVTDKEVILFKKLAPESADRVDFISNGVDAEYFSPKVCCISPFNESNAGLDSIPLVFTGAMDYWPNVDAVVWFVKDVLPTLIKSRPALRFYIVGRNPTPAVAALASKIVIVTGTVPDVRPFLQHATIVVAPLRVARGIQNKILEAMAMARPVIASQSCVDAIDAQVNAELVPAIDAQDFVNKIEFLLNSPLLAKNIGLAGRKRVAARYSWDANLSQLDQYLQST